MAHLGVLPLDPRYARRKQAGSQQRRIASQLKVCDWPIDPPTTSVRMLFALRIAPLAVVRECSAGTCGRSQPGTKSCTWLLLRLCKLTDCTLGDNSCRSSGMSSSRGTSSSSPTSLSMGYPPPWQHQTVRGGNGKSSHTWPILQAPGDHLPVITPVISGISRINSLITGVITHLLSGMSHQVQIQ